MIGGEVAPVASPVTVRAIDEAEEAALAAALLARLTGRSRQPFLEPAWRQAWWPTLGRGERLSLAAEGGDGPALLGTFFIDGQMAYVAGVDGADRLDLIGSPDAAAVSALLAEIRRRTRGFIGFVLHHLPAASPTRTALTQAAGALGLRRFDEREQLLPRIDLTDTAWFERITERTSLRRHERRLRNLGQVEVRHMRGTADIGAWLEPLFEQHTARWATHGGSLFDDPRQRAFYRALVALADDLGWLRMTAIELDHRPAALHLGMCLNGAYWWYKPSFDVALGRYSPGEVLLRSLLLAARDEGAHTFEFGLGDEPFKRRFATGLDSVVDVGLYEPSALVGETR